MALAQAVPQSYCERSLRDFQAMAYDEANRNFWENAGGFQGSGVCWWHSKLQRLSLYLATYAPHRSKPTLDEASALLDRIIREKKVTEIPGYLNFRGFSHDYRELIQQKLDRWQLREGLLEFGWVRGLKGENARDPHEFARAMDRLFQKIEDGQIAYVKLQLPRLVAHSWLVIGMKKLFDGYEVDYVDSNYPGSTLEWRYRYGDTTAPVEAFGNAGVYEEFSGEISKVKKAFRIHCGKDLP